METKKIAPSVDALRAKEGVMDGYNNTNSLPRNGDFVKNGFDQADFIKMLKDIDPGRYYMQLEELDAFEVFRGKDFCLAVSLAFRWGFVRGQQAEKNRAKRARAKKAVVA